MGAFAKRGAAAACAALVALALWQPAPARAADGVPAVDVGAYVVMDAESGQTLVAHNAQRALYPASITKIFTLGLLLESIGPDYAGHFGAAIEVSQTAVAAQIPGSTQIGLVAGEVVTLQDMLYATQIMSANDAANVLAEYNAGSIADFAAKMNQKAAELGLENCQFANPSGLPDEGHYITAADMARITRWALGVPGFRELFAATAYDMGATAHSGPRHFGNSNSMLLPGTPYYREGVTGSKTGYTDEAGYTLATTRKSGDTELICIVLQCGSNEAKYEATTALLDYCFGSFSRVQYRLPQNKNAAVPVYGGGSQSLGSISVQSAGTVPLLLHNSLAAEDVQVDYRVPERYVIGEPFAPSAVLRLDEGYGAVQQPTMLDMPLNYEGLDEILEGNTTYWQSFLVTLNGESAWLVLAPLAGIVLLLGAAMARVMQVRRRREQRRAEKLRYVRDHLPVRIAERPPPPGHADSLERLRTLSMDGPRRTAAPQPRLQMAAGAEPAGPRRAGRMR